MLSALRRADLSVRRSSPSAPLFLARPMSNQPDVGQRTYKDAIRLLNGLQSNAAVLEQIRASGGGQTEYTIPETVEYLARIGYQPDDLDRLGVLHVTGTKGKGSTSAFCDSILRTLAPDSRVGLYTSPHLVTVRERIRINGVPIDEQRFSRYFFDIWDRLESSPKRARESTPLRPAYFRYLTLMAFHAFLSEDVDATVLEVGMGGLYDTTNIIPQPIVTAVTVLGLDHVAVLGNTIEKIAAQKGGIFKKGVPALTVPQESPAMRVLQTCAERAQASEMIVVPEHPQLQKFALGLPGVHQRSNASLAAAMIDAFMSSQKLPVKFKTLLGELPTEFDEDEDDDDELPPIRQASIAEPTTQRTTNDVSVPLDDRILQGLINARWPGRCQRVPDPNITDRPNVEWFLDGAHTKESLEWCAKWYVEVASGETSSKRVLVFNCTSGRSAKELLGAMAQALSSPRSQRALFDTAIFCTNLTYADGFSSELTAHASDSDSLKHLTVQKECATAWRALERNGTLEQHVLVLPSIEQAIQHITELAARDKAQPVDVLVTGSLHLIGGVMQVASLPL
ncbi:uncharacterized protein L969DRAFT_92199 [Mixia osmundae IAM 14324]|uniref:Folylpolyglutamate synthase n=1 Tax=Mixia osmundae (strain CBS 9802 / IAM 14324 / JCM 22182 / KY 12970) TaxID=764103 RepID=G7DTP5_MIXOS|nr:uncharacterized protein L969DRAFT_92199 [Mixia osmundae IAM 14324]KEI42774.1 hypothetical protein L969DRAFT_92199 [Mixia osmundae IAM 14324]GAA93892.1 hypothetical protein E5Q_00538 [Mixia osmundae IAM 14324]